MPSPESSVLDLGVAYDIPVQAAKPTKKPPINQDVLIANVVKKSLDLKKKDDKILREAESLFQTKRSHSPLHFAASPKKPQSFQKRTKVIMHKPKAKKHHQLKSEEEMEKESGQLDNLFLTLREGIVDTIDTKKQKHKHHKKGGHKKQKKHGDKPHAASLLQIDSDIQMEASSLSKTHQK